MQKANLQTVYLLLGSNLGNSREILRQALNLIEAKVGVISLQSNYYETAPWGKLDQPNFLNLAIIVRTKLMPADVLVQTQAIENELGRVREQD
jgi:2-amino-4-hydroxy-6-hydroxymethyldihydropteridine diphosphokinase